MSSKKKIGIVIVVAVLAITFMTVAFLTTQTNTDYYTQIDNRWVTDIAPHGAMNYKYTLVAYDESGNAKDVTFETSKVLTDGAYLCLKVASFSWGRHPFVCAFPLRCLYYISHIPCRLLKIQTGFSKILTPSPTPCTCPHKMLC